MPGSIKTFSRLCVYRRILQQYFSLQNSYHEKGKASCQQQRFVRRQYNTLSGNRNVLDLRNRGVFQNIFPQDSEGELRKRLIGSPNCFYCGFDPTADSLHVGNLLALIGLLHCQRGGHEVIALIGGATGQIGDPSGRTKDRSPMSEDEVHHNVGSIQESIHRIFTNHQRHLAPGNREMLPVRIVNNADWYSQQNVIEFLSKIGRYFRMTDLLGRQSVKGRLESAEGMCFTEFTYQIFQSFDWFHLNKYHKCSIQIGGNDQLGNIVSGYDFLHKAKRQKVYGLTVPLVTTSSGDKLGKSAGNAVWLNSDRTSAFHFYQYFIQQPDSEVERYLRLFTFLHENDIAEIMKKHQASPESWWAQKKLAEQVTLLVHGEEGLLSAKTCTEALYHSSADALAALSPHEMQGLFQHASSTELFLESGTTVMDVVMKAKCFNRQGDADRIIRAGGVYLNHRRVKEPDYVLIPGEHILPNGVTLIRVGKRNYSIVRWLNHTY